MFLIGLTGSIGMGKSETAKMFAAAGLPVYDADATVHALYAPGGAAVAPVEAAFPGVTVNGGIDRTLLSAHVVGKPEAMKQLEAIVHPLTGAAQLEFLQKAVAGGHQMVVLDVPLLFETGGNKRMDAVVVCSAPADIQRKRVLERPGMTAEKLDAILAKQVPDADKRRQADYIVATDKGLDDARAQVAAIIADLKVKAAEKAKGSANA